MSRIDELVGELCPYGVEWKPLGEIGRKNKGTSITASRMKELHEDGAPIRVFAGGNTKADVEYGSIPDDDVIREPGILVQSRGNIGFIHYEKPFSHKSEMWSFTIDTKVADQKFVYYFLLTQAARLQQFAKSVSVKMPQLSLGNVQSIRLPVPPLEVQREIVRILDAFTDLEAKLEAELEARRRQFIYYRDTELKSPGQGVSWVTLNQISTNHDSKRKPITKGVRTSGEIPYYGASGVVDHVSDYLFNGDYLLVSEDGANLLARSTPIAFSVSGKSWVNNHAHVLEFDSYETRRFVEFYLNAIDLSKHISTAAQPKLTKQNLNRIQIPLPNKDRQEQIVEILDSFDLLVNDVSIGLPAELVARRKQYEYYRAKLLTFEEAVT